MWKRKRVADSAEVLIKAHSPLLISEKRCLYFENKFCRQRTKRLFLTQLSSASSGLNVRVRLYDFKTSYQLVVCKQSRLHFLSILTFAYARQVICMYEYLQIFPGSRESGLDISKHRKQIKVISNSILETDVTIKYIYQQ